MAVCSGSHIAEDHGFTSVDVGGKWEKCELGAAGGRVQREREREREERALLGTVQNGGSRAAPDSKVVKV